MAPLRAGACSVLVALLFAAHIGACAPSRAPAQALEPAPTLAPEALASQPVAAVSSEHTMIPGELAFFHEQEGEHIRVQPDAAVATIDRAREHGRSGNIVVRARGEGATTFDVVSASGVATHRLMVVRPSPGSLEEALVAFVAGREIWLFRRTSANEPLGWIVDGCFTEGDLEVLLRLAREHPGRVEVVTGRIPRGPTDRCSR